MPRWPVALWRGIAPRVPRSARRVGVLRVLLRSRWDLADALAAMADQVHALERDHALLAGHVSALTAVVEGSAARSGAPATSAEATGPDRLTAARLGAIAAYEQRIGELERQVDTLRHARLRPGRSNDRGTAGSRQVNEP